jgi:hypothetical protein
MYAKINQGNILMNEDHSQIITSHNTAYVNLNTGEVVGRSPEWKVQKLKRLSELWQAWDGTTESSQTVRKTGFYGKKAHFIAWLYDTGKRQEI